MTRFEVWKWKMNKHNKAKEVKDDFSKYLDRSVMLGNKG